MLLLLTVGLMITCFLPGFLSQCWVSLSPLPSKASCLGSADFSPACRPVVASADLNTFAFDLYCYWLNWIQLETLSDHIPQINSKLPIINTWSITLQSQSTEIFGHVCFRSVQQGLHNPRGVANKLQCSPEQYEWEPCGDFPLWLNSISWSCSRLARCFHCSINKKTCLASSSSCYMLLELGVHVRMLCGCVFASYHYFTLIPVYSLQSMS